MLHAVAIARSARGRFVDSAALVHGATAIIVIAAILSVGVGCARKSPVVVDENAEPAVELNAAGAIIDALTGAYIARDYTNFPALFHPNFEFHTFQSTIAASWGLTEELRLHRRMFDPQNIPPAEDPPFRAAWTSIECTWRARWPFEELTYGLPEYDPLRWRLWRTEFEATAVFRSADAAEYHVDGREDVIVAQDLSKTASEPGAFALLYWQDLGPLPGPVTIERRTWTQIKCGPSQ